MGEKEIEHRSLGHFSDWLQTDMCFEWVWTEERHGPMVHDYSCLWFSNT